VELVIFAQALVLQVLVFQVLVLQVLVLQVLVFQALVLQVLVLWVLVLWVLVERVLVVQELELVVETLDLYLVAEAQLVQLVVEDYRGKGSHVMVVDMNIHREGMDKGQDIHKVDIHKVDMGILLVVELDEADILLLVEPDEKDILEAVDLV